MKTAIRFLCLLGLILLTLPLSAQPNCEGPTVEVTSTDCIANFEWEATAIVESGASGCDFFLDPITGDSLPFGEHTFGPFTQQSINLFFACNFNDSCWTSITLLAPENWPCNSATVCDITFNYEVDTTNANCGFSDGQAIFNLTTNTDYTITVTNQDTGIPTTVTNTSAVTGLEGGFYTYEIFCADGSTAFEGAFAISETVSFNASIVSTTDDCSNYTLITEVNVPGTYTYLWSTGETTQAISISQGGTYAVTVTDADGCSDQAFISLETNAGVQLNASTFNETCDYQDGGIWGNVGGGTPPYTYDWSDGFAGGFPRFGLSAGTYSLTVTDAAGCSTAEDYIILSTELLFELGVDLFCDGQASLMVYPLDSAFNLTYAWEDPNGVVFSTDQSTFATQTGTYSVTVTDENGCSGSQTFEVLEGNPSNIEASIQFFIFNDTIGSDCDQLLVFSTNGPNGGWLPSYWEVPGQTWSVWATSINPATYGPGLYIATHYNQGQTCPVRDTLLVHPEDIECGNVSGTVYLNLDTDCSFQDEDIRLEYQQLVFENLTTGNTYYGFANFWGYYSMSLPAGNYSITLGGSNDLLELCSPLGFTLAAGQNITDEDVPTIGSEMCPRVEVTVNNPLLRRCFDSPVYINFENTGTVVAEDVVLTVEVGAFASEVLNWFGTPATSIVTDPVTGITTATFEIGDLDPFEGGQRTLLVYSCSVDYPLGAAGCIKATVTPNNPCPPADPDWTGASLRVAGSCEGDSITFRVANVGSADMSTPLSYIVIEDGVLLSPEPFVDEPVAAFDERLYSFTANGSTYHFQVEQEPLHPGLMMPIDFVEACGNGQISYGFALQFPLSDDAYWIDEECNELIGAYDPNDKRAMPRGYSDNRYIEAGDMIDYTIRFQNTGTDTAFNVVVRDTLSEVFDLSTLEIVSSTHPMQPRVDSSGRALAFFYNNIMLPDSFVNEPASHGAVSFRIRALADLEPGTDVDNGAAIYFDFNEPIFTNVYDLEIGRDFVTVGLFDFTSEVARLNVFPNPTSGPAMIELPAALQGQQLQLEVFDLLGRQQLNYSYQIGDQPRLDLSQLPAGWYTLRLSDQGKALGTGRVLLQR